MRLPGPAPLGLAISPLQPAVQTPGHAPKPSHPARGRSTPPRRSSTLAQRAAAAAAAALPAMRSGGGGPRADSGRPRRLQGRGRHDIGSRRLGLPSTPAPRPLAEMRSALALAHHPPAPLITPRPPQPLCPPPLRCPASDPADAHAPARPPLPRARRRDTRDAHPQAARRRPEQRPARRRPRARGGRPPRQPVDHRHRRHHRGRRPRGRRDDGVGAPPPQAQEPRRHGRARGLAVRRPPGAPRARQQEGVCGPDCHTVARTHVPKTTRLVDKHPWCAKALKITTVMTLFTPDPCISKISWCNICCILLPIAICLALLYISCFRTLNTTLFSSLH